MSENPLIPTMCQQLRAPQDINGNMQRCWIVMNHDGRVLDVVDEDYAGMPKWLKELTELPSIEVTAKVYKRWLKSAAIRVEAPHP